MMAIPTGATSVDEEISLAVGPALDVVVARVEDELE